MRGFLAVLLAGLLVAVGAAAQPVMPGMPAAGPRQITVPFTTAAPNNWGFTRTGPTATQWQGCGLVGPLAANTPRFESDCTGNLLGFLTEPAAQNLYLNSQAPVTQSFTVTAQAYTLSAYGTGKLVLSGTCSGTLQGSGANTLVSLTFTPTAGTCTQTYTAPLTNVQFQTGTVADSRIPTTSAALTRNTDNLTVPMALYPWVQTPQGSTYAGTFAVNGLPASSAVIWGVSLDSTHYLSLNVNNSGQARFNYLAGSTVSTAYVALNTLGSPNTFAVTVTPQGIRTSINGAAVVVTANTAMPTFTTQAIGRSPYAVGSNSWMHFLSLTMRAGRASDLWLRSYGTVQAAVENSPLSDAYIAVLRGGVSGRQRTVLASAILNPFPSPVCGVPATTTCMWGQVAQALRLLAVGGTSNVATANTLLQSWAATAPTVSGYGVAGCDFVCYNQAQLGFRAYMQFNSSLTATTQTALVNFFWNWGQPYCTAANVNSTTPNVFLGSENIGSMSDASCEMAAYIGTTSFPASTFADGTTPATMLALYKARVQGWLKMQGTHGSWIEDGADYNKYTMGAVLQAYDVMPDPTAAALAQSVLDLYWAHHGEQMVGGAFSGPRTREYIVNTVTDEAMTGAPTIYFAQGTAPVGVNDPALVIMLTSTYVPAAVVYDITLDPGRGSYETYSRQLAYETAAETAGGYFTLSLSASDPGEYHDAYVTPAFAMGSMTTPLLARGSEAGGVDPWAQATAQNWWNGVVFSGALYGTNKVTCQPSSAPTGQAQNLVYAGVYAVQSKGTMICLQQPSTTYSEYFDHASVWIGNAMAVVEQDGVGHTGWVFVNGTTGYAAIKVAGPASTYSWGTPANGAVEMMPTSNAPVVIQAGQASDYASFSAFQTAVEAMTITVDTVADTITVSGAPYGAATLLANYSTYERKINGTDVTYNPAWAWNDPYISSPAWGSTPVTIAKATRTLTLNF